MVEGYSPIPRNPSRYTYIDPVVIQRKHNKAYFTIPAEELLGMPDELVFFSDSNGGRAVRAAQDDDAAIVRRTLDPGRGVTVPKHILAPGHYVLKLIADGLFALIPTPKEQLRTKLTAKTRRELRHEVR